MTADTSTLEDRLWECIDEQIWGEDPVTASGIVAAVLPLITAEVRKEKADTWDEALAARTRWEQDQRYYSEDDVTNPYRADESEGQS